MNSKVFRELEVLKELYVEERPMEINLKRLAEMLGVQDADLANAMNLAPSTFSRTPYASSNQALNQWMGVFNLIIDVVQKAEPELSAEEIKLKMQRWLRLARPEFQSKTPLEMMLAGKTRPVRNLLEQLVD